MTQDLKLDGGVTLKGDTTDLASDTATFELKADNSGTWCTTYEAECYNQSLMTKQGTSKGYLYNWYAATAGSGTQSVGVGVAADYSICPKGWKLPTGNAVGQFVDLDKAYDGSGSNRTDVAQRNKFLAIPLNFNYTGSRTGGSTYGTTMHASYWSRTASSTYGAYRMYLSTDGYFYPQYNSSDDKYNGFVVRCLASS